jgi:hypothetical protein
MQKIEIDRDLWGGLSKADQDAIVAKLREAGSIGEQDVIVGSASANTSQIANMRMADGPCQAACTAAYGRATQYCSLLPIPAARAACYAAAMAAYAVCLRSC